MKLLNQSLKYLSVSMLPLVSIWALVFYFNFSYEIRESIDEGLEHYKRQIIYKIRQDPAILAKTDFEEGFYAVREISRSEAAAMKDRYTDTLLYMQDADDDEPEAEPVRMLTTALEHQERFYRLCIINSMVEEDDLIGELLWEAIWLYLILLAGLVLLNNFVLQRLWKPFYSFLNQLKDYRLGSSALPVAQTQTKEFTDLQLVVTTLLQHSAAAYEQQKEFTGNASHELQTPLAIALNKLELMLEKGDLDGDQTRSIAEVMNTIERLARLNKSLLLLAKIESRQFTEKQSLSINRLVRQCIGELEEIAAFRQVSISVQAATELFVEMDAALAMIVVANLVRNALFHNIPSGTIHIDITANMLQVSNTGPGKALNAEKIFSRFYKSGTGLAGTGLGLAIVKAICERYGFSISYHFRSGRHEFVLCFSTAL